MTTPHAELKRLAEAHHDDPDASSLADGVLPLIEENERMREALTRVRNTTDPRTGYSDLSARRAAFKVSAEALVGRLEMSEAAGIVDGWRERADAAERKLDVMTARADAYEAVLKHIAEGTVPPEPHGHYLAHRDAVRHARTVLRSTDQNDD